MTSPSPFSFEQCGTNVLFFSEQRNFIRTQNRCPLQLLFVRIRFSVPIPNSLLRHYMNIAKKSPSKKSNYLTKPESRREIFFSSATVRLYL